MLLIVIDRRLQSRTRQATQATLDSFFFFFFLLTAETLNRLATQCCTDFIYGQDTTWYWNVSSVLGPWPKESTLLSLATVLHAQLQTYL
jgi:hypothetical protein